MLTSDGYQLIAAFDSVDDLMAELAGLHAELPADLFGQLFRTDSIGVPATQAI